MMKKILLLLVIISNAFVFGQEITFASLKNLFTVSVPQVKMYADTFLELKFEPTLSDQNKYVFFNGVKDDDKVIVLQLIGITAQDKKRVVLLNLGKNVNLEYFKSELISNGFYYNGEKNINNVILDAYVADDFVISITKPNDLSKNNREVMIINR